MPIKFNKMPQECREQEENGIIQFIVSPPPVKKHLLPATCKQGKLALASCLHPQNGLNSKEGVCDKYC